MITGLVTGQAVPDTPRRRDQAGPTAGLDLVCLGQRPVPEYKQPSTWDPPVNWDNEREAIQQAYPDIHLDHRGVDPLGSGPEVHWEAILAVRKKVYGRTGFLASATQLSPLEAEATKGFVTALTDRWAESIMRSDGSWKEAVVDTLARGFEAGVEIVGTSEWDASLNSMVEARGLAVTSSQREYSDSPGAGNAIIYDPKKFRCLESQKLSFSSTLDPNEKIAHLAVLENLETGGRIAVQSAHLEKCPESFQRNIRREEQLLELGHLALQREEMTTVLLADLNSEATLVGGAPNPVDTTLREVYGHVNRPQEPTSVTAQRSMSLDVVAARPGQASWLGFEQRSRLSQVAREMADFLPGGKGVLPNETNPSDHTWAIDAVPTPGGGVIAGTWNVLDGSYRNPLKGNLFYPMVFLFDDHSQEDQKLLKQVVGVWGAFYNEAKSIPGWKVEGGPDERLFLKEYLAGPILTRLNEIREETTRKIQAWTPAERAEFEQAQRQRPDFLAAHRDYPYAAEALYLITRDLPSHDGR